MNFLQMQTLQYQRGGRSEKWATGACGRVSGVYYKRVKGTKPFMITSKTQMLKVIQTAASGHALTREEKFKVFATVCDNMLSEGRITKANHIRWTNVF